MNLLKPTIANIIGGLAVAVIIAVAGYFANNYFFNKTKIISPQEGDKVSWMTSIEGTFSSESEYKKKHPWIVVQPIKSPKYHPQTSGIQIQANHKWNAVAYIGESDEKNSGEKFLIHLVLADETASLEIERYIKEATLTNSWDGLDPLSLNLDIAMSISVYRR